MHNRQVDIDAEPVAKHPRYGRLSVGKPIRIDVEKAIQERWNGYVGEVIFPESAIVAQWSKMKRHGAVPPEKYADVLRRCNDCDKHFVFFALEQKHWYEQLGFFAGVGGHRCYA